MPLSFGWEQLAPIFFLLASFFILSVSKLLFATLAQALPKPAADNFRKLPKFQCCQNSIFWGMIKNQTDATPGDWGNGYLFFQMVKLNFYPIEATSCIYWKIQIRKRRLEICWQMSRYSSPLNGGLRREMKCFKCVITWQRFIFRRFLYTCIWFFFDEKTSLYSCSSIIKRNPIITFCCVRKFTFCQFYGKTYFSYRKIE